MISKNQARYFASLKEKKFRESEGKFLAEGVRLCEELLASGLEVAQFMYAPELLSSERARKLVAAFRQRGIPSDEISVSMLRKVTDTVTPQGIVAVVLKPEARLPKPNPARQTNIVAFAGIQDPGNLGTILRSAAWFGIDAVLLDQQSVDWSNPKVVRASMGAVFYLPIIEVVEFGNVLDKLVADGFALFLLETGGETILYDTDFSRHNIVLLGGETSGAQAAARDLARAVVRIPRFGKGDSLNVSIAASIVFSELAQRGDS